MRPIELTIEGFRSFKESTKIDFRGRNLVGILGPIGSGKSTLLDAICFALYGKTPTIGQGTRELVNQKSNPNQASVELVFRSQDGNGNLRGWLAQRIIRTSSGGGQVGLYEYDLDLSQRGRLVVDKAREMNERIETILGIDFDGFSRSILLAQGRFAEFLNARPSERDVVLKGVFGLQRIDEMREEAGTRLNTSRSRVETLEIALDQSVQARSQFDELSTERTKLENLSLELTGVLEKIKPLAQRTNSMRENYASVEEQIRGMEKLRDSLPRADETEILLDRMDESTSKRTSIDELRKQAETDVLKAEEQLATSELEIGGKEEILARQGLIEHVKSAAQSLEQADQLLKEKNVLCRTIVSAVSNAVQEHRDSEKQLSEIIDRIDTIEKQLIVAKERLKDAEKHDKVGALLSELEVGDSCPICGSEVTNIIRVNANDDLTNAGQQKHDLETQLAETRDIQQQVIINHGAKLAAVEQANQVEKTTRGEIVNLQNILERSEEEFQAVLTAARLHFEKSSSLEEMVTIVGNQQNWLAKSELQLNSANQTLATVIGALATQLQDDEAMNRQLNVLSNKLSSVAAQMGLEVASEDDISTSKNLRLFRDRVREKWKVADADLRKELVAVGSEIAVIDGQITIAMASVSAHTGNVSREEFDTYYQSTNEKISNLNGQLSLLQKQIDSQAEVIQKIDLARKDMRVFETLRRDLTDSRFVRFLLEAERSELASEASDKYAAMSGDRYRFTNDGDFNILDFSHGGQERSARTLSGGETFLASLSLALGLSEMISRKGGRLDSFFLDEGFGSLDEEHIELAMTGIEQLVNENSDRLVLLVSHVPALRERLEDVIELTRDREDGHTRLVAGGARPA
jgi:exonuclease SbcC